MAAAEEAKPAMERGKSTKRWSALKGIAHANAVVKSIPHGIDSETFLGDTIPAEVRCVRNLQCSNISSFAAQFSPLIICRAAVPTLYDVPDHRSVISQVVSDIQVGVHAGIFVGPGTTLLAATFGELEPTQHSTSTKRPLGSLNIQFCIYWCACHAPSCYSAPYQALSHSS